MSISGRQILEDTLRRGFAWTSFQTLLTAGGSNFDFPILLTQFGVYYGSQGLARYVITKVDALKGFKPETQRILVYSVAFFATIALAPSILTSIGRKIAWQQVAKQAAALTAFWFFLNPNDEFVRRTV